MGTRKRIDKPPLLCYTKPNNTKGSGGMKKQISVLLLFAICVLLFSSCSKMIVCNSIDTSFLNIAEKDGEMYIQSQFDDVYSIDFENKKYVLVDDSDTRFSWFEEDPPNAFKIWFHQGGAYQYTIPEGYEGVTSYVEGCELENDGSVVDACGYVKDGLLVGFVQVYADMRTVYANYAIEEIDHSLIFTYNVENDEFTVVHRLDGVVVVAVYEDTIIYWKDKAYYKYDLKSQSEIYLIEDKAYDAGFSQLSSSGVYFNSEFCIIHMTKGKTKDNVNYMYVYNWSNGDFFELTQG